MNPVRLVVASRLSPPRLVHTRRSGKPPISRTPARSTTCARAIIRPASSQAPARGAPARLETHRERPELLSVEPAGAMGAHKEVHCLREGRRRTKSDAKTAGCEQVRAGVTNGAPHFGHRCELCHSPRIAGLSACAAALRASCGRFELTTSAKSARV